MQGGIAKQSIKAGIALSLCMGKPLCRALPDKILIWLPVAWAVLFSVSTPAVHRLCYRAQYVSRRRFGSLGSVNLFVCLADQCVKYSPILQRQFSGLVMPTEHFRIEQLLLLMKRLRDPETGCPWDLKQDYDSIVPYTIEEVYEVVDAIARKDWPGLQEELGDLLFQVVFYCQLGEEQGRFAWPDIVQGIVSKLVRRHPHVFPDGTLHSSRPRGVKITEAEIKENWQKIKAQEKAASGAQTGVKVTSAVNDKDSHALPAMARAQKLQVLAAGLGFDFEGIVPVIAKVKEEITELELAIANNAESSEVAKEMGDILFSCVNLCRFLELDAEVTMARSNDKFKRRFCRMEELATMQGLRLQDSSSDQQELFWVQAKQEEH